MKYFLSLLGLAWAVLVGQPLFAQNEKTQAETVERSSTGPQNKPQLNRIVDRLRQQQAAANGTTGYPDAKQIQHDLVGHSLAEGVDNGYRPDDWCWTIEEGQISRLRVVRILEKTDKQYLAEVQMRLSNGYYAYDAKVKIKYILAAQNRWKMDYAVSQGMYIVVTHEYDACVRSSIADDGWGGGTNCALFTNRSEMSLVVGGDYLTDAGWQRFTVRLSPHSSAAAGGVLNGGHVYDYRINFVVRIN